MKIKSETEMNTSSNLRYFSMDMLTLTQRCQKPILLGRKILSSQPFPHPGLITCGQYTARNKLFQSPSPQVQTQIEKRKVTALPVGRSIGVLNMARSMHSALSEIQTTHKSKRAQMIPKCALHDSPQFYFHQLSPPTSSVSLQKNSPATAQKERPTHHLLQDCSSV